MKEEGGINSDEITAVKEARQEDAERKVAFG